MHPITFLLNQAKRRLEQKRSLNSEAVKAEIEVDVVKTSDAEEAILECDNEGNQDDAENAVNGICETEKNLS